MHQLQASLLLLSLFASPSLILSAIVPCPFSPKCLCEENAGLDDPSNGTIPAEETIFLSVNCTSDDVKEKVPQFISTRGLKYSVINSMSLIYYDSTLGPAQFDIFEKIGRLFIGQLYRGKFKCDDSAFDAIKVGELQLDGFADYFPLPQCVRKLGSNGMMKMSIADADTRRMEANAFRGFVGLADLDLNGVHGFDEHAFDGLERSLNVLALTGSEMKTVPREAISGLSRLVVLNLAYTSLYEIRANDFENLTHLSYLNLDQSQVVNIQPGAFHGNEEMRLVSLQDTGVGELDMAAFAVVNPMAVIKADWNDHLWNLTASSTENFPTSATVQLRHTGLQRINKSVGQLLNKYPKATLDISNSAELICDGLEWMGQTMSCTKNVKIDGSQCRDGEQSVALDQYLKKYMIPASKCREVSGAIKPAAGMIGVIGTMVWVVLMAGW